MDDLQEFTCWTRDAEQGANVARSLCGTHRLLEVTCLRLQRDTVDLLYVH